MLLTLCFVLLVGVLNFALGYFTAIYFGGAPAAQKSAGAAPAKAPAAKVDLASLASALNAATAASTAPAKPAATATATQSALPSEEAINAATQVTSANFAPLLAARDECQEYCQSLSSLTDELARSAAADGAGAPQLAAKAAEVASHFPPLAQQLRNVAANLADEHSELSLVCSSLDLTLSGGEDLCQTVANEPDDAENTPPTDLANAWQSRLGTLGETANAVASQLQEIERMLATAMNTP